MWLIALDVLCEVGVCKADRVCAALEFHYDLAAPCALFVPPSGG